MTYVVALTGGIGSGKSTASALFAQLGVPIIDSDLISRLVVKPGSSLLHSIVKRFGPNILQDNGALNRRALRRIIFDDFNQKAWLEALLHPKIEEVIVEETRQIKYPYCIVVIPLLTEHYERYQHYLSHVIVVDALEKQQLSRATARDHDAEIAKIMDSQASREARLKIADTILDNEGDIASLKEKITHLHHYFLKLCDLNNIDTFS